MTWARISRSMDRSSKYLAFFSMVTTSVVFVVSLFVERGHSAILLALALAWAYAYAGEVQMAQERELRQTWERIATKYMAEDIKRRYES